MEAAGAEMPGHRLRKCIVGRGTLPPPRHVEQHALDRTESLPAPHLEQIMGAVDANMQGQQASQKVASKVEDA